MASGNTANPHAFSEAQRLQLLVESVQDYALFMLDPDGLVATWNSSAQKIFGYLPGEAIGQHFSRFFTAEDVAEGLPVRILHKGKTSGRFEVEGWCLRKDGSRFFTSFLVNAVHDQSGALIGYAAITHDISERVAAQQALRESERRFHLLVQGIIDYAIYMLDPSGVVTNWNEGAQRMKGYAPDEIVGEHFSCFYTDEDRAAGAPTRVLETARAEGRFEAEGWRLRKDGSRFWASVTVDAVRDETGELLGFAKITRDITERLAAQHALADSDRQLRLFIRGVTDYALVMLDPNGIVTSWNLGAERIKGHTADEIIGQHFSRFYTESDRADGLPARVLDTAVREGRYEAEGWRVRKDGSVFWASVVIDAIRNEAGKLIGFAKITRDITERRNAQLALHEAQKQRAQAQKLEALGHLTGGVAHDFNNLLMVVGGYVQTLKKLVADNPKGLRAAQAIELAAQRGQALTRQLLSFARRQPLNVVTMDLKARLDMLRPMLKASTAPMTELSVSAAADLWPIKADSNEFDLALVNLVLNANDACPDGGVISVAAENVTLKPQDTPARLEGEFVAIVISDNGCGIPPDVLERVFDPFFTTKPGGNGLGLSQVHGMVHQSGGTATLASELGKGTRVTLYFRRSLEAEQGTSAAAMQTGHGTALLVEDNPEVADATATVLEELGFAVRTASGAPAAMRVLEQERFDLMVTDIVMAGPMNGLDLARSIRRQWPDLPVVVVTGYSDAAEDAAKEFTVLRKPYRLEELGRAIAAVRRTSAAGNSANVVHLRTSPP